MVFSVTSYIRYSYALDRIRIIYALVTNMGDRTLTKEEALAIITVIEGVTKSVDIVVNALPQDETTKVIEFTLETVSDVLEKLAAFIKTTPPMQEQEKA